jgi:hypothetical protein
MYFRLGGSTLAGVSKPQLHYYIGSKASRTKDCGTEWFITSN